MIQLLKISIKTLLPILIISATNLAATAQRVGPDVKNVFVCTQAVNTCHQIPIIVASKTLIKSASSAEMPQAARLDYDGPVDKFLRYIPKQNDRLYATSNTVYSQEAHPDTISVISIGNSSTTLRSVNILVQPRVDSAVEFYAGTTISPGTRNFIQLARPLAKPYKIYFQFQEQMNRADFHVLYQR